MLASSNLVPDTMGHGRNLADALHSGCSFSRFESEMAHQIFAGVANRYSSGLQIPVFVSSNLTAGTRRALRNWYTRLALNSSFWEFESPRSHHGGQARLGEQRTPNPLLPGSIPGSPATRRKPIGQAAGCKPVLVSSTLTRRSMRRR